ncbi:MAG: iron chelate uptake ABC transporter family permease subunit, partial [Bacteroidaceae bacterium]|nr:iron chelate uptake ABC transporter family permease subunit [Bacteroidaceae bacterium]
MRARPYILFMVLGGLLFVLFTLDMMTGSLDVSFGDVWGALMGEGDAATVKIVRHIRLIKAVVAVLVGASLSVSGLQMQTLFRNPLAGPYVLGITSGASLGVALLILGAPLLGVTFGALGAFGVAGAAWVGAAVILMVTAAVGARIKDIMVVLILGMMFSSG